MKDQQFVLLNAFHKKSLKTPSKELYKAVEYMNEFLERSYNDGS